MSDVFEVCAVAIVDVRHVKLNATKILLLR